MDAGLSGGAKLSQKESFCSGVRFPLHGCVRLMYLSMHSTGQRDLSCGKAWNKIGGLFLPCLECLNSSWEIFHRSCLFCRLLSGREHVVQSPCLWL